MPHSKVCCYTEKLTKLFVITADFPFEKNFKEKCKLQIFVNPDINDGNTKTPLNLRPVECLVVEFINRAY